MQVSVESVRLAQTAYVYPQCHAPLPTLAAPKLEKRPPELLHASPWRRLKPRHPTMSSSRERDNSLNLAALLTQVYPDSYRTGSDRVGRGVGLIVVGKRLLKEPDRCVCSVPLQLTRSVDRGLSNDPSVSALGSRPSAGGATPVSRLTSCSGSAGCATGFSTEHSSIYSWRYDEFDRANTRRVRQIFSALDELLYEGKLSSKSEALQKECEEWNTHSPHLRILGNQLEPPKQDGVQYIHRGASSARAAPSPPCLDKREDHSGLCVEGHRLAPGSWSDQPACNKLPPLELSLSHIQQVEEVYEAEGRIEEFLAYDGKETESEGVDQRKASAADSWDGVPPVSPKACLRDAVADELFDDAWRKVVGLLEELVHKHWEKRHSDVLTQRRTVESSSQILGEPSCRLPSRSLYVSPCRGPNSRSMFLWANNNNVQDSSVLKINLNGVMTIQAKPLQQRQQGFGERSLYDSDDGAKILMCTKTQGQRGATALSHKPAVQWMFPRLGGRARMRQDIPAQSTQVLRGTRLTTVAEDLLCSPVSAAQNHRLPLIHTEPTEQDCNALAPRYPQALRGRIMRGGAPGTVDTLSSLAPLREPTMLLESLSRPNTTHSFRSDTPLKSSFTPMDFASNMRMGRGLLAGDLSRTGHGTSMGVTGFSITCSTASGFSECATLPNKRANFLPSINGEGRNTPLLTSIGPRKALSRFPVPVRKKFQVLLP